MDNPNGPNTHEIRVTRTALKGGGATYHLTLTPASERIIKNGADLEGMTANIWIASAVKIRLICLAQALVALDEEQENETKH